MQADCTLQFREPGHPQVGIGVGAANKGHPFVRAVRGPLPEIPLWVSGMVPAKDAQEYLRAGANLVGLTNELFPANLIQAQDWTALTEHMRNVLRIATM